MVIEGNAPREPKRSEQRDATGSAASNRAAIVLNVPAALARRAADDEARDRRTDLTAEPPLAEQRQPVEPAVDPVRRLKASLGRTTQSIGAATARMPAPQQAHPFADPRNVILASAIYVTGSRGLLAGSRYGIALFGEDLRILGPVDVDPGAVAIRHALRGMDATGLQGRLIITATDGRRDQLALVFMSVAGDSPEGVADAIIAAATELRADAR